MQIAAKAKLPTEFGFFNIYAFSSDETDKEHMALVKGIDPSKENKDVLLRIHSCCRTGDTFSSLKCDCRVQLVEAMQRIEQEKRGVLLYMDQEGRGIGLVAKIKAYALQEQGLNTFEANEKLGYAADARNFDHCVNMLRLLNISSVRLLTNNPDKINALSSSGIEVVERIPTYVKANEHNQIYLKSKKDVSGHLFD